MQPARSRKNRRIIAGIAMVTVLITALATGNAYGRLLEWASMEWIYTPVPEAAASSNCLSPEGQKIVLTDWLATEDQRTVTIGIFQPAQQVVPSEPTVPVIPPEETTAPTDPTEETVAPTDPTEDTSVPTDPTEETTAPTNPTEETTEETTTTTDPAEAAATPLALTEETTESTDLTEEPTTPTDPTEEATDPTEPPQEEPVIFVWEGDGVTITLDALASQHLTVSAQVAEDAITVLFQRKADAPGLARAEQLTAHILWNGLEGTVHTRMQPYGEAASGQTQTADETDEGRQIVTGLELLRASDTINASNPISYIKLNPETLSDFSLRFTCEGEALNMVRWSLDGGKTYSLLYDNHQLDISWPYEEGWDGLVLLDFSQALQSGKRPTINVKATGYEAQEFIPVLQALPEAENQILKATELPDVIRIAPRWGAAQLRLQPIQRLTTDEETGKLAYAEYPLLSTSVTSQGIQVKTGELLPAAGSYRMTVQWVWEELVIEEQILYFFINTN